MTTEEIRAELVASLQQNVKQLDAMKPLIQEIDEKHPEVWEDGQIEKKPREQWDNDYFVMLTAELLMNCSKDTLLHAMEVGKVVAAKRESKQTRPSSVSNTPKKSRPTQGFQRQSESDIPKVLGIVIGGIALIATVYVLIK